MLKNGRSYLKISVLVSMFFLTLSYNIKPFTVNNNLVLAEEKGITIEPKNTLDETTKWLKSKMKTDGLYNGKCKAGNTFEGNNEIISVNGCEITIQEMISIKNINPYYVLTTKNIDLKKLDPYVLQTVELPAPEGCNYNQNNIWSVSLNSLSGDKTISLLHKDYVNDRQTTEDVANTLVFYNNKDAALRSIKALRHAIKLCASPKEPF